MIVKTVLYRTHLLAALVTAGDRDIRPYLNGVSVEIYPDRVFVVSTDGYRASVFRSDTGSGAVDATGVQLIIPRDLAEKIGKRGSEYVPLTFDTESKLITLDDDDAIFTGHAIDGAFPDWRRILPHTASGETAQYQPSYIADWAKVAKILGCKFDTSVHIWHNGESSALVTIFAHPEFRGVLMPFRAYKRGEDKPTFPDKAEFAASSAVVAEPETEDLT